MKRIGNIYPSVCTIENLQLADMKARAGKLRQPGVMAHLQNEADNLAQLHEMLVNKTFKTSAYRTFTIYEPKERHISSLPYYPDRIVHHAIMNILEPVFVSVFTADTYSCIKGRGIHKAANNLKKTLRDTKGTQYCLKLDVRKFYPSIDHNILKALLRRKFKDADLLWLLDEIIDSAEGLPIGNYLSQYFANFYLTYFDHWLKEQAGVRYYFRYSDDMVILAADKQTLHSLLAHIRQYLADELNLSLKPNYQVFPVAARGIDFVGYRFYHTHTLLRKSIKKNLARKVSKGMNRQTQASYNGWLKHCDSKHLAKKLLTTTCNNSETSASPPTIKDSPAIK